MRRVCFACSKYKEMYGNIDVKPSYYCRFRSHLCRLGHIRVRKNHAESTLTRPVEKPFSHANAR